MTLCKPTGNITYLLETKLPIFVQHIFRTSFSNTRLLYSAPKQVIKFLIQTHSLKIGIL